MQENGTVRADEVLVGEGLVDGIVHRVEKSATADGWRYRIFHKGGSVTPFLVGSELLRR